MSIPKTTVLLLGNVSGSVTVITTTYLCGLDFLDSEHTSVAVVGNPPTMLTITKDDKETIVDKKSIQGIMTVYVCKCKVELLLWEVDSAYVRSDDIDRLEFVTYIAHNIMGFKLEGTVRRCRINFIPDNLYQKYLEKVKKCYKMVLETGSSTLLATFYQSYQRICGSLCVNHPTLLCLVYLVFKESRLRLWH